MERVDTSLPVLILHMEHHGALGVMRSLGRLGVPVYGVHHAPRPIASYSRYCRKVFVMDLDNTPPEQSVEQLLDIAQTIGRKPLLIATNDETALFVAQNATNLQDGFLFPNNPFDLVWCLYNKKDMHYLAKHLGIPTPETVFPESRQDVVEFCERAQFPVMLKAADNIRVSRRTRGTKMVIVRSKDELLAQYDAMADVLSDPDLMMQEYIPGGDDSVWMFNGYFDDNSRCLFGITAKKIHQTPVYTGMTALGICLPNAEIESATKALAAATGYKGIIDIGYRYDARDSSYKLLDVNPRLGASFRLFVATNGMDVLRAQYFHFTGRPIPPSRFPLGRKWIVEDADLISCIQYYRDGVLRIPDWVAGYAGIHEYAWFAADDVRPFLRVCSSFALRPFRKILRIGRRLFRSSSEAVAPHAMSTTKSE